jgi:hypothetical protein
MKTLTIKFESLKVGQKITYLGHPATVIALHPNHSWWNEKNPHALSVAYDKGYGRTVARYINLLDIAL